MRRKAAAGIVALGLLGVPASSLSLGSSGSTAASESPSGAGGDANRGFGTLVAKDSAKQHPEAAVARAKLKDFGKVSYVISTKPDHLPVEWAFIVRCQKGSLFDYFPGPGDVSTKTKKATIRGTYQIPLADPDLCDFQVAGQIGGETELRGRVFTKIYDKG